MFGEAVALVADALESNSTPSSAKAQITKATEDVVMDSWTIGAGHVAGVYASWQGRVGDRTVVELNVRWRKGQALEPDWPIKEGHVIRIDGRPTVTATLGLPTAAGLRSDDLRRSQVIGMIMTADAADQRDPARRRGRTRHRDHHQPSR